MQTVHILMVEFQYNRVILIEELVPEVCVDALEVWRKLYERRVREFRE